MCLGGMDMRRRREGGREERGMEVGARFIRTCSRE